MPLAKTINKLFFLIPAIGIFCMSCGNKDKGVTGQYKKVYIPDEVTRVESLLSQGSKVKGKLTAPFMLQYLQADTPYAEFPRSLHVDFYNDTLKIESQMDALYGKYFQNLGKVF